MTGQSKKSLMEMVAAKASRLDIVKHFSKMTMFDIIRNKEKKGFRQLTKKHGEEKVINAIALLLRDTSNNYDKVWSKDKCQECAIDLYYSEYYYLSLEDLFVLLKEVKENESFFTLPNFKKHLAKYAERKLKAAENAALNQHMTTQFTDAEDRYKERVIKGVNKVKNEIMKNEMMKNTKKD